MSMHTTGYWLKLLTSYITLSCSLFINSLLIPFMCPETRNYIVSILDSCLRVLNKVLIIIIHQWSVQYRTKGYSKMKLSLSNSKIFMWVYFNWVFTGTFILSFYNVLWYCYGFHYKLLFFIQSNQSSFNQSKHINLDLLNSISLKYYL